LYETEYYDISFLVVKRRLSTFRARFTNRLCRL